MMMNWKGFCRKRSWPNLRYYSAIRVKGLRKSTKNLNQNSRSPGPRIEPGTSRIRSISVNHSTTTFGDALLGVGNFTKEVRVWADRP
jgi:hypothetical protein